MSELRDLCCVHRFTVAKDWLHSMRLTPSETPLHASRSRFNVPCRDLDSCKHLSLQLDNRDGELRLYMLP